MLGFEGKSGVPGEKPLGARKRLGPTTIEPRSHWWEASALITAPTLLPQVVDVEKLNLKLTSNLKDGIY